MKVTRNEGDPSLHDMLYKHSQFLVPASRACFQMVFTKTNFGVLSSFYYNSSCPLSFYFSSIVKILLTYLCVCQGKTQCFP